MRAIFERGASDHNFAPVAEQKRAKNSRFSASIFRSRAKTAQPRLYYIELYRAPPRRAPGC
jgi:hypothetical protein